MDANIDLQIFAFGFFLQSENELALRDGAGQGDGLGGRGANVVTCFGKEECLE